MDPTSEHQRQERYEAFNAERVRLQRQRRRGAILHGLSVVLLTLGLIAAGIMYIRIP